MPTAWIYGTLAEAMTYANGLAAGTAYIQLLSDVKTSAPLEFASGKVTILDMNGQSIDCGLTEAIENGNVITVNGNLTLCDTSTTEIEKQGKVTGSYNTGYRRCACLQRHVQFVRRICFWEYRLNAPIFLI